MLQHDRSEILRTCQALFAPGQVAELRGLDAVTREWRSAADGFGDLRRLGRADAGRGRHPSARVLRDSSTR